MPEYRVWQDMLSRCFNPNNPSYVNYGQRGITVCEEWRDNFLAFYKEVGERPTKKHWLERIDNNKGYIPGNVKWALPKEQHNNKRTNRLLTYRGKTQSLTLWAEEYRIKPVTLIDRLRGGWSVVDAITKPVEFRSRRIHAQDLVELEGETHSLVDWCFQFEIDFKSVRRRMDRGWCLERALKQRPRITAKII